MSNKRNDYASTTTADGSTLQMDDELRELWQMTNLAREIRSVLGRNQLELTAAERGRRVEARVLERIGLAPWPPPNAVDAIHDEALDLAVRGLQTSARGVRRVYSRGHSRGRGSSQR
jgi:hypothetical protein